MNETSRTVEALREVLAHPGETFPATVVYGCADPDTAKSCP
jgi:hypothetical protein